MGAELIGRNPVEAVGRAFYSSYVRLVPLLLLVRELCPDMPEDNELGLDAEQACLLGETLEKRLADGLYEVYMREGKHELLMAIFHRGLQEKYPDHHGDYIMPKPPPKKAVEWYAAFLKACGGYDIRW
jgi:hypothetical protein